MKQLFRGSQSITLSDWLSAMHSEIANFLNRFDFEKEFTREVLLEGRLVNQRAEIIVVRQLEDGIVFIQPVNGEFQRAPRIEATASRICAHERFDLHG